MEEVPLAGGNISAGVVRVGQTVRRPVGKWTPAVHALLRHLENRQFQGAPRVLGIDDKGREVLTYIEGDCLAFIPGALDSAEILFRAGNLVSILAASMESFEPPDDAEWWDGSRDPHAATRIIHNDLAPWNVIASGEQLSVIDWDFAGPGRFDWEAAYALYTFVVEPALHLTDAEMVGRIRSFGEGAGLNSVRLADVLSLVPTRTRINAEMIERLAREGHPGYIAVEKKGHAKDWRAATQNISQRITAWLSQVGG
ncbi:phosphotransferase [Rudaeicoccus suwonensis]|uniref:Phosphotransferase family enzyme n=1 Tax=Rudaeicoccus suwonensis TaxID=657409 RepID=A0A561DVQ0_9MICO|nr:phosphotransferase [Rudaeicoccus suwonensis]TWE07420.1 phosphotransferase family enzyme [Rudaeicoccus suwonensis]